MLVLEPDLLPSEFEVNEWNPRPPPPWTKDGALIVESALGVLRVDARRRREELLYEHDQTRDLSRIDSASGQAVYLSRPPELADATFAVIVDIEAGAARELPLELEETLEGLSGDGKRLLTMLTPPLPYDGKTMFVAQLPVRFRVRDVATLKIVHEWKTTSGVRFTQPGLARVGFSRDGAHVFLPSHSDGDEIYEVATGKVIWRAKAVSDSRAEFGEGLAVVNGTSTLSLVDLRTRKARTVSIGCGDSFIESLGQLNIEQRLYLQDCERGMLLADFAADKPRVERFRGKSGGWIGPGAAVSMLSAPNVDGTHELWLRTHREEKVHAVPEAQTAVLRRAGDTEIHRTATYLQHHDCRLGARTVRCTAQLSPEGSLVYDSGEGALMFFDPTGAHVVHQIGERYDHRHQRSTLSTNQGALYFTDQVAEIEIPVRPGSRKDPREPITPLRPHSSRSAQLMFELGELVFFSEPAQAYTQTAMAAPVGTRTPVLRLLLGVGFALIWDAHNHVQIAGDRDRATHWLRCTRREGQRMLLLPFETCAKHVEATLL